MAARRVMQDFTDKRIPELVESIKGYCPGRDIAVNVSWDSFEGEDDALQNLWLVFEQPSQGLQSVCQDELGRQAVAEKIHEILIVNVGSSDQIGATVSDGVLTVSMRCADAQAGTPGWPEIERVVTASL
jgi:hypothetical protein